MNELADKLLQVQELHQEYLKELQDIEGEERQVIHDFLERVKAKKIAQLQEQLTHQSL